MVKDKIQPIECWSNGPPKQVEILFFVFRTAGNVLETHTCHFKIKLYAINPAHPSPAFHFISFVFQREPDTYSLLINFFSYLVMNYVQIRNVVYVESFN